MSRRHRFLPAIRSKLLSSFRKLRMTTALDVTELTQVEEAVGLSEREMAEILSGFRDIIIHYVDPEARIIWTNQTLGKKSDTLTGHLQGKFCREAFCGSSEPCEGCAITRAVKTGEFQDGEIRTPDGRSWMVGGNPIRDHTGKVIRVVQVAVNITRRRRAEKALQQSEEKHRMIFEHSPLGIVQFNRSGVVTAVNESIVRILDSSRERLLGFNLGTSLKDGAARAAFGACVSGKKGCYEGYYRSPSRDRTFPIKADYSPLYAEDGSFLGGMIIVEDISERLRSTDSLQESESWLRFLSSRLLTAQEEERKKIARELHDSLGSSLSAIKLSLLNIRNQADCCTATVESLETSITWTQQAIDEVRRMIMDLRPSMIDSPGIVATIGWLCAQFEATYPGIAVEEEVTMEEEEVPENLKIIVLRIVQEAFHNIAKHSEADLVRVFFGKKDDTIELVIEDNGKGFDLKSTLSMWNKEQGLGLVSMKERTELSEGVFAVKSVSNAGTTIRATWPL